MDNQSIQHIRWNCLYHIVFISRCRREIMHGETKRDLVEIINKLCEMKQVEPILILQQKYAVLMQLMVFR